MKTIKLKVYSFNELKPEIQEKVIENHTDINTNDNYWYDFLIEEFKADLNKIGIDFDSLEFDVYRNEISFYKPIVTDTNLFLSSVLDNTKKILESLEDEENDEDFYIVIESNGSVSFENYSGSVNEERETELTELLKDKLKDCLKALREQYEYNTSEESIKETLVINEFEFLDDGTISNF